MKTAKEILTYAGLDYSHWGQRILIAEQCGFFTAVDKEDASSWITCACGKLEKSLMAKPIPAKGRAVINRAKPGPLDLTLRKLGETFEDLVKRQCIDVAATLLVLIEDRAVELLLANAERENNYSQE